MVTVDDASLAELGRWPWSRARVADLLTRIDAGGPRVIGIDLVQAEPTASCEIGALQGAIGAACEAEVTRALAGAQGDDARLAAAIRSSGRIVLGYFFDFDRQDDSPYSGESVLPHRAAGPGRERRAADARPQRDAESARPGGGRGRSGVLQLSPRRGRPLSPRHARGPVPRPHRPAAVAGDAAARLPRSQAGDPHRTARRRVGARRQRGDPGRRSRPDADQLPRTGADLHADQRRRRARRAGRAGDVSRQAGGPRRHRHRRRRRPRGAARPRLPGRRDPRHGARQHSARRPSSSARRGPAPTCSRSWPWRYCSASGSSSPAVSAAW